MILINILLIRIMLSAAGWGKAIITEVDWDMFISTAADWAMVLVTIVVAAVALGTFFYTKSSDKKTNARINKEQEDKCLQAGNIVLYKFLVQRGVVEDVYKNHIEKPIEVEQTERRIKADAILLDTEMHSGVIKVSEITSLIGVVDVNTIFGAQHANKKYINYLGYISDRNKFIVGHMAPQSMGSGAVELDDATFDAAFSELKSCQVKIRGANEKFSKYCEIGYTGLRNKLLKKYPDREADIFPKYEEMNIIHPKE